MNRPHENNARFVHTFIQTVTSTPIAMAPYLRILRSTVLILFSLAVPITLQADVCEPVGSASARHSDSHRLGSYCIRQLR